MPASNRRRGYPGAGRTSGPPNWGRSAVMRDFAKQIRSGISRFVGDRAGNISPMVVLMLVPLAGVFALAVEMGNVTLQQRVQQHAADSAVLAAAQSNDSTVDSGATLTRYQRDAA